MIKIKYILAVIFLGAVLSGCIREPLTDNSTDDLVRISVKLNTPSGGVVTTRSTEASSAEQDLSGNVVAMVFDSTDPKVAKLKQAPVSGTINGATLTAQLKAETTESYICIAANISNANKTYLLGLSAEATLAEITSILELTVTASGMSSPLPMSGWSGKISDISKNSTSSISVSLSRSVARIDVDGSVADFKIYGVQLVNGAKKGWVLPQETLPYFGETDVIGYTMSSLNTPATTFTERIYCFENAGMRVNKSNPTRVVIKGQRQGVSSPSYYAMEIVYKENGGTGNDNFDIERNKIYTIKLNKVDKDGYASYEEAARSEAFNSQIESDIVVTDPYAYNIVTNGKQYMGVTNSEFVLYPVDETTGASNLLAATLSYTSDSGWSEGNITAPNGIELVTSNLEVQHGSAPLYRDVIIKSITPGFTSGVIVAHIGNLRQEIKVTVKSPTQPTGQIINDYFSSPSNSKDYKVGEIIAPTAKTSWLKVSSSNQDTGGSSLNDKITNPEGGIYVHVQPNVGFDESAAPREGSLFVAGVKDNQRVRIYVQQNSFDVYSGKLQIVPFTYVGTYHRWNQTAERLIRIDASQTLTGVDIWWQATVVAGREFIVLSTDISADGGITCINNPYGIGDNANYKTDEDIEANCQVNSILRTVRGNTNNIYFKVGLTGKLSGPAAAPRYGLIALTYGAGKNTIGTHNIYVRQGEASDYIMRPWDASTTPINPNTGAQSRPIEFDSSNRPKAIKFGVYNLTDPEPSKDVVDLGPRGYSFVQYPSQGGYYFLASGTQAIKPTVDYKSYDLNTPPSFSVNNPWQSSWETCPKGYRRPNDGVARATTTPGSRSDIENSEVRQSLWLFPLYGVARSDFSNQLGGYLADGYFDRREIKEFNSDAQQPDIKYGIVEKGTVNAAYWGFLVFNPHNYASIFAPMGGTYREDSGQQGAATQGRDGYFHTKTPGGAADDGWLVAFGYFSGYVFDSYEKSTARTGYSIRCIKDEQPAVGTDDPQVEKPTIGGSAMVINLLYINTGQSLEQQIGAKYTTAQLQKTNTVAVNAKTTLTDADYKFLNDWANKTDHVLRHVVIRNESSIPQNAFTSSKWYTISLVDVNNIATDAFTATLSSLKELSLPYLDAINVNSNAFQFNTENVQLFLNGTEYNSINDKQWKSYTWRGIKKY